MQLIRFRSLEEYEQARRALDPVPGLTDLPSGVLAVPDHELHHAATLLAAAGIDWRDEPIEGFTSGRAQEEERE